MIHTLHEIVWGPVLLTMILGTGAYFSWRSGLFQLRGIGIWWKATAGSLGGGKDGRGGAEEEAERDESEAGRDESSAGGTTLRGPGTPSEDAPPPAVFGRFHMVCTALAATIGTGNIAGVATALVAGGPGAVFWMWVSAVIGMMTAYAEVSLGIRFRKRLDGGGWFGGPCAYLAEGLHMPHLALVYGLLCLGASLGMGSMVQSNAVAQSLCGSMDLSAAACGVVVTVLAAGILLGGAKRIAAVTGWLIPVSAAVYVLSAALVLVMFRGRIPGVLAEIFRQALLPRAVLGGAGGYGAARAFRYGIARGVFSNEAGLGTLAGLHGAAGETTPQEQGMWAMFEVFFDTMVICTMTALVILCVQAGGPAIGGWDGAALAGKCFGRVFGTAGEYLVSAAMAVFAFSTMIAWFFLGKQTLDWVLTLAEQLLDDRKTGPAGFLGKALKSPGCRELAGNVYLALYAYAVFLGCVSSLTAVWELSDVLNGLMAFPNLFALFMLRRQVRLPKER